MVPAKLDQLAPGLIGKLAFVCDLVLVVAAVMLASDGSLLHRGGQILASITIVAWVVAATVLRLYAPFTPRSFADQVVLQGVAVVSVTFAVLVTMFASGYWLNTELFVGLTFCVGSLLRLVLDTASRNDDLDEIVIIGTGVLGVATYNRLRDSENRYRKHVIGFLRFEGEPALPPTIDLPLLPAAELTTFLADHLVDEVFIGARVLEHGPEVQKVVEQCERFGVPFAIPVHSVRLNRATLRSSSRATDGYLHYQTMAVKPVQAAFKRLGDVVLSSVALFVLSPLLVGVAIAIKLTSPGPVFFRQVRVGLHGTRFGMLKFRSMVANAEALRDQLLAHNEQSGPVFKMQRDPRITALGAILRKFSIDELPQLVNVLRGDMTIVGPRPPIPTEVSRYQVWQRRRLSVRPGLTCFWQVQGRNKIGFEQWMRLDLLYIDHWSLMLDLRLILATVPVVLGGKGAS
jgi:exopolysaccharide biosynthesis polyprenyl glycosylphosphotransferase